MIQNLYVAGSRTGGYKAYLDNEEVSGLSSLTVSIARGGATRAVLEYYCEKVEVNGPAEIVHVCPQSPLGVPDNG